MTKILNRYLAWDGPRLRYWVSQVRTAENGVTVVEDLSGWED